MNSNVVMWRGQRNARTKKELENFSSGNGTFAASGRTLSISKLKGGGKGEGGGGGKREKAKSSQEAVL